MVRKLIYYIDIKDEANKVEYVATLDAQSGGGISAKDVAGRSVPGLDEIKLDKITVTNDQLVADLEFFKDEG